MNLIKKTEFLLFIEIENEGNKTKKFKITDRDMNPLAIIKWATGWRRYCFYPEKDTQFDFKCLFTIISFIDDLMQERQ